MCACVCLWVCARAWVRVGDCVWGLRGWGGGWGRGGQVVERLLEEHGVAVIPGSVTDA